MNNINVINHLQKLTHDRFALSVLSDEQFGIIHEEFLKNFNEKTISYQKIIHANPAQDWYLIGTDGCHLCHTSQTLLAQTSAIYPNIPTVHVLDLADSHENMVDTLGNLIPLLLTPKTLLCYPFGVLDLIHLAN